MNCLFEVENFYSPDLNTNMDFKLNVTWTIFGFRQRKTCSTHNGTLIMANGAIRKYDLSRFNKSPCGLNRKIQNSVLVGYLPQKIFNTLTDLCTFIRTDPLIVTRWNNDTGHSTYYYYYPGITKYQKILIGSTDSYHPNLNVKYLIKIICKYTGERSIYLL